MIARGRVAHRMWWVRSRHAMVIQAGGSKTRLGSEKKNTLPLVAVKGPGRAAAGGLTERLPAAPQRQLRWGE